MSLTSPAVAMSPPRGASFSGCRTIAVTTWPRSSASFRIADPTKPVAPNNAIFICDSLQIDAGRTDAPLARYLRELALTATPLTSRANAHCCFLHSSLHWRRPLDGRALASTRLQRATVWNTVPLLGPRDRSGGAALSLG